jgi:hypothetical protein
MVILIFSSDQISPYYFGFEIIGLDRWSNLNINIWSRIENGLCHGLGIVVVGSYSGIGQAKYQETEKQKPENQRHSIEQQT